MDAKQQRCYLLHVGIAEETASVLQSKKGPGAPISLDEGKTGREALFFLTLYQILAEAEKLRIAESADV